MDTEDGEDGLRSAMFGDEMLYREEGLEGLIGRAVYRDIPIPARTPPTCLRAARVRVRARRHNL